MLTGVDNSAITFKNEAEWLAQRVVRDVHCVFLLLASLAAAFESPPLGSLGPRCPLVLSGALS